MPAEVRGKHAMALKLHMTVGEIEARMSPSEFAAWDKYFAEVTQHG